MTKLIRFIGSLALLLPLGIFAADRPEGEWQTLYKMGKPYTPYTHYSTIVDGVANTHIKEFGAEPGPAFFGMKVWASSPSEAAHMARLFAKRVGFSLQGEVEVYKTEPSEPPSTEPRGYDIKFTPYVLGKK